MRTHNRKKARGYGPALSLGDLIGETTPTPAVRLCERHKFPQQFTTRYNRTCSVCGYREEKILGEWKAAQAPNTNAPRVAKKTKWD